MGIFTPKCVYFGDMEIRFYGLYRVLQAVGPQIRCVGQRKWSGYLYFCIIIRTFLIYLRPNMYIFARMCIFLPRSLGWLWSFRIGKLGVNMRHLWS